MAVVFDFSKESNDYRQRIAVVFKALFERDFLENFDIVLNELFNGHYSIKYLKEAIEKNKRTLLRQGMGVPVINKKDENEKFANTTIKMVILVMMLGEEYIKLKDILNGIESKDNLDDSLEVLNHIVDDISKTRDDLRHTLRETNFDMSQRRAIDESMKDIDDIVVGCCISLRMVIVDDILSLSEIDNNRRFICESIVEKVSVIIDIKSKSINF